MNYLAHSYLSFTDQQLVGQFLQDFIRNKERFSFPPAYQQGIMMHRFIDTFTDSHESVQAAKEFFRPVVGLYAGAFVDVAFDYFLAQSLSAAELKHHSEKVYRILNEHYAMLPHNLRRMVSYMEKDNWLYNYRSDRGIEFSMRNVLKKARYLNEELPVFHVFLERKQDIRPHFNVFFPELKSYCKSVHESFAEEN